MQKFLDRPMDRFGHRIGAYPGAKHLIELFFLHVMLPISPHRGTLQATCAQAPLVPYRTTSLLLAIFRHILFLCAVVKMTGYRVVSVRKDTFTYPGFSTG